MGHLKNLVGAGGTVHRFVTTPFIDDPGLMSEVQTQWVQASVMSSAAYRANFYVDRSDWKAREMKRKVNVSPIINRQFARIQDPTQSVLYILGHSDRAYAEIGGRTGPAQDARVIWWEPRDLVRWLTNGSQPLPRTLLAVKIWSCYSATNGFLAAFAREMVRAGYRDTHCVGYTAVTGAMYGHSVPNFAPHTKAAIADDAKTVLGRAKDHREIIALPRRMPPPPAAPIQNGHPAAVRTAPMIARERALAAPPPQRPLPVPPPDEDDDPYADIDVPTLLQTLDERELPRTFLSPRLGGLKH